MTPRYLFATLLFLCLGTGLAAQTAGVTIQNPDTIDLCRGQVVELLQTNTVGDNGLRWGPDDGSFLDPLTDPSPRIAPRFSRYYRVQVAAEDGTLALDSVWLNVDSLVVPELIGDTTVCQFDELQLVRTPIENTFDTRYVIRPTDLFTDFGDSTDINTFYRPEAGTGQELTVISQAFNGACADTQTVRVDVIEGRLEFTNADTVSLCVSDEDFEPLPLSLNFGGDEFEVIDFFPQTGLVETVGGNVFIVQPRRSITYFATANVEGCFRTDSVRVEVDSLPENTAMTLDPVKDPYCPGDSIRVTSPLFEPDEYPNIAFTWQGPGLESPRELYNAVFRAVDTTFLFRRTTAGACRRLDSILVNVVQPVDISFLPDTAVCAGEAVQIVPQFDVPDAPELMWSDPNGSLSCTDCLDPVATVTQTTEYEIMVIPAGSDCQSPVTYTLEVLPPEDLPRPQTNRLCTGESLSLFPDGAPTGFTYLIEGGGSSTDDPTTTFSPTATTSYSVTVTGRCTTATFDAQLLVDPVATVTIDGPATVCEGDDVTLTATVEGGSEGGSFDWSVSGTDDDSVTFTATTSQTVSLTFTDRCGDVTTATFELTVVPVDAGLEIVATDRDGNVVTSASNGNTVTLSVLGLDPNVDYTIEWRGNYSPATATGPSIDVRIPDTPTGAAEYTATVTPAGSDCPQTLTVRLPISTSRFEFPEVFSPNRDGTNDGFGIFFDGMVTNYNLVVLNRWGQKVFTSSDPAERWDGTKDGTPQNPDVYYYIAQFTQDGTDREADGQVTLVR